MDSSCIYQIYPLGFCGAPKTLREAGRQPVARIRKVIDWIPHLKNLGVDTVLFNPVFESSAHGYDTANFGELDPRLGTNADFAAVCDALHANGMRVWLDGVFNHVGRDFWAFQDVRAHKQNSIYKDWFIVNFDGDSNDGDGFWYEGWEGHYELVKLNLHNPAVREHIFQNIRFWVDVFDIDGLRLDVAYCLDEGFLRELRGFCDGLKPDFFLVGEVLFGDYNRIMGDGLLHSCTNYEVYKGLHSSLNSRNLYELTYSLNRQFGPDAWCLYRGKRLLSFADNHDVSRLASVLTDPRALPLAYALLFTMPGLPCLYYGSEWGATGDKADGDHALRLCYDQPVENECFDWIQRLIQLRRSSGALRCGGYQNLIEQNEACLFARELDGERVFCAFNIADTPVTLAHGALHMDAEELLSGARVRLDGDVALPPRTVRIFRAV